MGPVAHHSEAKGRSVYRIPRGEALFIWTMVVAMGFSCAEVPALWVVHAVAFLLEKPLPDLLPAILGTFVWMSLVGAAFVFRLVARLRAWSTLEIDTENRSVRDGRGVTSLAGADAVKVKHHWPSEAHVVVRDSGGGVRWVSSGLRPIQARALAMDLAEMLSLPLPAEPDCKAMSPEGSGQAVFTQDQAGVRIGVWSEPIYGWYMVPAMMSTMMNFWVARDSLWLHVGMWHATLLLMILWFVRLPRWTELEIRDDRLMVREGWQKRVKTIPLAAIAPLRLVKYSDQFLALVVRTHDGRHFEWVGRSEVLRQMQQWIMYAQGLGVPAAPAPPTALLELRKARK